MEVFEDPRNVRLFIKPDHRNPFFAAYKKAQACFWVEEEIDGELHKDAIAWPKIDPGIQTMIIHQIAFFLIGDGIVNNNIAEFLENRITDREILLWYNFQKMIEDIHNIVYVKLADVYIRDADERRRIFDAIAHYPNIKCKIEWVKNHFGESRTLARQVLIGVIMEGLFFQGSFCIIFWYGHYYGDLPGLTKANEFIARDEGLHTDFGIQLYRSCEYRLATAEVEKIICEAVDIETGFMRESMIRGLGMNLSLMRSYLEYIADQLLIRLGYSALFGKANPFKFMEKQSISIRIGDFFADHNISEYGHHSSGSDARDQEICFE